MALTDVTKKSNLAPLLVATVGVLFLYSSLKNVGITTEIRDFIKGKDPFKGGIPSTKSSGGSSGGSSGSSGSSPGVTSGHVSPGTPHLHKFQTLLLKLIGAPATPDNYTFLTDWAQREGTAAKNNPIATTYRISGSTDLSGNPAGVQNYPSVAVGAMATAKTLLNGLYPDIVAALRSGHPLGKNLPSLSKWSGGGYSSIG